MIAAITPAVRQVGIMAAQCFVVGAGVSLAIGATGAGLKVGGLIVDGIAHGAEQAINWIKRPNTEPQA